MNNDDWFQSGYARFLRSYAKKYCTEIHLSPFLLYLPFIMMLIPMILVAIDKLFVKWDLYFTYPMYLIWSKFCVSDVPPQTST